LGPMPLIYRISCVNSLINIRFLVNYLLLTIHAFFARFALIFLKKSCGGVSTPPKTHTPTPQCPA
jgi:hypothetical protein